MEETQDIGVNLTQASEDEIGWPKSYVSARWPGVKNISAEICVTSPELLDVPASNKSCKNCAYSVRRAKFDVEFVQWRIDRWLSP